MRGIISFIFLIFMIEFILTFLILGSVEYNVSNDILIHSLKNLDFYGEKIKIKRELQDVLKSGSNIQNPVSRINYVAKELENYEDFKENNSEYDIDLWCGYLDASGINSLLNSNIKPLPIKDMDFKINTKYGEIYYCSTVLVYNNELNKIVIGRNSDEHFNLIPVIGFKIKSKDNKIMDVDYIIG